MRSKCKNIYDQGELGSCTANALAQAIRILKPDFEPSRLFIYYNELIIESDNSDDIEDNGANVFDGCTYISKHGVCEENLWPYDITKFNIKPPIIAYNEAEHNKIISFNIISRNNNYIDSLKKTLVNGSPILLAILIFESFESYEVSQTGNIPIPNENEKCLGGHEVLIIGYDDDKKVFNLVNSWSDNWGDKGFFILPYSYIENSNLTEQTIAINKFY